MPRPRRRSPVTRRSLGAAVAALVLLAACADGTAEDVASSAVEVLEETEGEVTEQTAAVVATLEDAGLSTLASTVSQVDIGAIAGSDEFTLFAPNDDAFLSLTADELANLTADEELLADTLRAHTVAEPVAAEELTGMSEVTTVAGTTLPVSVAGDEVTVGNATVVETDISTGDGVVHVVDALLETE